MTIPFDFTYYRPESVLEATQLYHRLKTADQSPLYYSGGTEIISMARVNNLFTQAIIDIKYIPECNILESRDGQLIIGAAITLTRLTESNLFPLLSKAVGRIADHTIQGKITIGGNICGTIIYKEGILPFMLADSQAIITNHGQIESIPFAQLFNQGLLLPEGELLLQIVTDRKYSHLPYVHAKKTRQDKIDYPLLTISALQAEGGIRAAFSGLCAFPFRSLDMEKALNETGLKPEERVDLAIRQLPHPVWEDLQGTAAYKLFVLKHTMLTALKQLEGD